MSYVDDIQKVGHLTINEIIRISNRLEYDIKQNSYISTRNTKYDDIELESFRIKLSKPIIDEIDKVLAKHYGFTEEELDFIINYDIKYRMGDERSPYCPHSIGQRRSANGRRWPWSVGFIHGWRERY